MRPGQSTALALSTCLSFGSEISGLSKYAGSGQKRTVVPVLFLPTSPTTSSFEWTFPLRKEMLYSLPPRRTQHSRCLESAFTTDTPTPCNPPENL